MSAFDDWLRFLAAARKGPWTLYATRGRAFSFTFRIPGNYTASTPTGQIRLNPDAGGSPLASFTFGTPTLDTDWTVFSATLDGATTTALPAAPVGENMISLPYDILIGGVLLFGGLFHLGGRVTA